MLNRTDKRCPACKQVKPRSEWFNNRASYDGLTSYCAECHKQRYTDGTRKRAAEYARRTRDQAIAIYGGVCVVCGSSVRIEFDHVKGDGGAHRAWERVQQMYRRIVRYGRPLDDVELQLLCHAHHVEKTRANGETGRPTLRPAVPPRV